MIRALFYILQVAALAALTLWIISEPGVSQFEWLGYSVAAPTALLVLFILLLVVFWTLFLRGMDAITAVPGTIRRKMESRRQEKGFQALTQSLVAIASARPQLAYHHAQRAQKLLPQKLPITDFLLAYAAKAEGRESDAYASYERLLHNKDAAYLGLRGLVQSAITAKDYHKALRIARQAVQQHKHDPSLLKAVYDLEIQTKDYSAALNTLHLCAKAGGVSVAQEESDSLALWILLADADQVASRMEDAQTRLKRARKIDSGFTPLVERELDALLKAGQTRKAEKRLVEAWAENPHPALERYWVKLAPANKPNDTTQRLKFFERLPQLAPEAPESYLALAQSALDDGFWGEARRALMEAEKRQKSTRVYRMLAKLEEKSGNDTVAARRWLEKAADAPPDPVWYCRVTGRIYTHWAPIAEPHGAFNTISWGQPGIVHTGALAGEIDPPAFLAAQ